MSKIYRFRHALLKKQQLADQEVRANNPVPITIDDRVVGFAVVEDKGRYVLVKAAIDAATPERLDLENGFPRYWFDVVLDVRNLRLSQIGGTVFYITSLILTRKALEGQESIDGTIGELE